MSTAPSDGKDSSCPEMEQLGVPCMQSDSGMIDTGSSELVSHAGEVASASGTPAQVELEVSSERTGNVETSTAILKRDSGSESDDLSNGYCSADDYVPSGGESFVASPSFPGSPSSVGASSGEVSEDEPRGGGQVSADTDGRLRRFVRSGQESRSGFGRFMRSGQESRSGEDPFGEIPFKLLDPEDKVRIQCDGCARWLPVHPEVAEVYGNAKGVPFFCSTVGLKRCHGC